MNKLATQAYRPKGDLLTKQQLPLIAVLSLCGVLALLAPSSQAATPSLLGKWYGLQEGSPMTVEFRKDGTISVKVEANSNASFTCQYRADYGTTPVTVDLTGIH